MFAEQERSFVRGIYILLDPIRDYSYLTSLQNPTEYIKDAGVGIVDNVFFLQAGHFKGGLLSAPPVDLNGRTFLCWFGSSTYHESTFSLFCAKVLKEYKPGMRASEWLDRPFLVVSYKQISADVINWFNQNYPTGTSSSGVGNPVTSSTSGAVSTYNNLYYVCNSAYGCVSSGPPPGNVNGNPTLKQVHFMHDPLDDTVLIYFSITTPNWNPNTKAIYVYKIPVSFLQEGVSIDSVASNNGGLTPTTTSTPPPNNNAYFLGGLTLDDPHLEELIAQIGSFNWKATSPTAVFSAPQFTISFDWMKLTAPYGYKISNGYLPALLVAVESPYMIGINQGASYVGISIPPYYPHGDAIWAFLLQDVHNNPAHPKVFYTPVNTNMSSSPNSFMPFVSYAPATDIHQWGMSVDKFGSILPMENDEGVVSGYAVLYTAPSRQDVDLSAMRMRILFIEPIWVPNPFIDFPYGAGGFGFATTPGSVIDPLYPTMGLCRPYLFTMGGKTYVTLGGYHADNYINGVAVEVDPKILKPSTYKRLIGLSANYIQPNTSGTLSAITGPFGMNGRLFTSFGKKYGIILLTQQGGTSTVVINSYPKSGTTSPYLFGLGGVSFTGVSQAYYGNPVIDVWSSFTRVIYLKQITGSYMENGEIISDKLPIYDQVIDTAYYSYKNIAMVLEDD